MSVFRMHTTGPHVTGPYKGMYTGVVYGPNGERIGELIRATEQELYDELNDIIYKTNASMGIWGRIRSFFGR